MSAELIVDARDIHAWYGSSHVLHGVDLQIARGQTVGLLGRNGMGKSTLIRSLLGLVSQREAASISSARTPRTPGPTRWHAWAWPMCPKAVASFPT